MYSEPPAFAVQGTFDATPIHASSTSLVSLVAENPTFSEKPTWMPNIGHESVTVEWLSPAKNDCALSVSATLNATQVGVNLRGDMGTCRTTIDAAAKLGIKLIIHEAPYPSGAKSTDITITLRP